ncbi:uncharacterized protein LOC131946137 [Physella acuta]|uniref:uncharacterized protein LOC131946137 n=1 Tax=Physella acuta TaxID=109671 RepID=UPI0027DE77EF|nr:uncharacterized protein LOC131946137 [Physella acuta]
MASVWVLVLLPALTLGYTLNEAINDASSLYTKLDSNNDGFLSKTDIWDAFLVYDCNHDNKIAMDELKDFTLANVPSLVDLALIWGSLIDTNHDSRISPAEYDVYFATVDQNGDGKNGVLEFGAYVASLATNSAFLAFFG